MTEIMPFPENKCETDLLDRPISNVIKLMTLLNSEPQ